MSFTDDQAALEEREAVKLAYLGICARGREVTPEGLAQEALNVSSMLSERSFAMTVLTSTRIREVVESIMFEQTSQRFVISFRPLSAEGVKGDPEKIRSERCDGSRGAFVRSMWSQTLVGDEVVIFKHNEPDASGKVSHGFRTAPWVVDRGRWSRS